MNMAETDRERPELFRIAEMTGLQKNPLDESMLFPEHEQTEISVFWEDDRAILSTLLWDQASWKLRLALLETVLATFDCILNVPAARLNWAFSSKHVDRANAGEILSQWIDEGAPPVMQFIDFPIVDTSSGRSIRTLGLAVIFGYEIDAVILDQDDEHLAKMVAHLAQDLLRSGPLTSMEAVGPDGHKYRLEMVSGMTESEKTLRITTL